MAVALNKVAELPGLKGTIFIDGESGTVGLGIRDKLERKGDVSIQSLDHARRKDPVAKRELLEEVDLVVLCLPDDAARETVALVADLGDRGPKVLDASTAHRVAEGWVYGFPELCPGQEQSIRDARRVACPGCYPTGGIALIRPLVDAGIMPPDYPLTVNAVSGFSGGGKSMIAAFEARTASAFELYGLELLHKHLPELQKHSGLTRPPIFVPSVGNFRQGMLVSVPLHLDTLNGSPSGADLHHAIDMHFSGSDTVHVMPFGDRDTNPSRIEPEALNNTNLLELRVYANATHHQAVLIARLDNLGKGASGAAVQDIELMLGQQAPNH